MMSKAKLFLLVFALIFIVILVSVFFFGKIADNPGSSQRDWIGKKFEVVEGDTWRKLGLRLKADNLIRSLLWYKIQLRLRLAQNGPITLKAGSYTWPRFLSTWELIDFFQIAQPQKTYPVTIPEGLTRREVAQILEQKRILLARDFLDETSKVSKYTDKYFLPLRPGYQNQIPEFTLEGLLFPDTYFLPQSYSAEKMVELMLQNFMDHLQEIVPNWRSFSPGELYQKLILSSIIQKEYRSTEEAPIIASVFHNRLEWGMRLESCATVVYVLTEELGRPHPHRILFKDLEEKSPYNTYLNQGLPPHPIASVGAIALNATFYPAKTDYLFFVVKDATKGTHTFSDSFGDHNAAREAYINNYFR